LGEEKQHILFLCTGNSCRSQMAEGWLRTLHPQRYAAYSAGIEAHKLNALAVQVMDEVGIDISSQRSQSIDELADVEFDLVITVCGHADSHCPTFPEDCRKIHVPFDDPPALAKNAKNENEALSHYRRVRDELRSFVVDLPALLKAQEF